MYKFIRYFNQNREKIIRIIVFIIFLFLVLQFFNKREANKEININQNTTNQTENMPSNINVNSALGGGTDSSYSNYKSETDIITQFIEHCNNGETEEAYNQLSKECKEIMYPTLESFIENYYRSNFSSNKVFNIQRWTGSIYKVELKENMLQTGRPSTASKRDYMKIVYQDKEKKLNINNYIGRTNLNEQCIVDDISIEALYKDTFMNYETYTLKLKNSGKNDVCLDNLAKASTIYLVDENGVQHMAYSHELATEQLQIQAYSTKQLRITFSNGFVAGREYSEIVFENVVLNTDLEETTSIGIKVK